MKAAKERYLTLETGVSDQKRKEMMGDEKDKRKYGPKVGRNGRENTHIGDRVRG